MSKELYFKMMVEQKQIWHNMGIEAVLEQLKSTKNGLTGKEAKEKHYRLGSNKLPEEKPISKIKILFEQFKSPLIYILVIAGIITLVLQDWTDSVVIFAAVFLNAGIGYFQENKTSEILSKLKKVVRDKAIVVRNGQEKEIRQSNLVVGDVVVLRSGDKVPADGRLIENLSLRVNESALTGEWLAAEKKLDKLPEGASLADRKNMIYMGTVIESGRAKAVITGIGIHTEIGKIAQSIQVVGVASTAIFIGGVIAGRDLLEIFVTTVAVAVAAIPEGLPVAITVIMALGMERILKKKGLVRKLVAAEVLGSTSVICTDKTGTLTQAKMQVTNIFADSKDISHELVSKISIFCTEAFVENTEDPTHKWIIRGRPTEKALLLAALQTGMRRGVLEKKEPKIDMLPFDPVYKYSAALHEINKSQDAIYILGAPELILEKSKFLD
ncbi:MAG: cation-translocating P-type ATPase, partial [Candidatus Heimdallarchaeota archaeon]